MNNELMLDVGQANELKLAFRREGAWTNERIKELSERRGLLAQVLDVLEGRSQIVLINPEIITVNYGMSLEEMITAGHYDWVNGDLTAKRFPTNGKGETEFEWKLFDFGQTISSEDAKRQIGEAGWEAAKTEHLLAFGAKHPDAQRKNPIIALGSVGKVDGRRNVPCLRRVDSERYLNLYWWGGGWDASCRFLAVRKISRPSGS